MSLLLLSYTYKTHKLAKPCMEKNFFFTKCSCKDCITFAFI